MKEKVIDLLALQTSRLLGLIMFSVRKVHHALLFAPLQHSGHHNTLEYGPDIMMK